MKLKISLLIFLWICTAISWIHPIYPNEMMLQHSATLIVSVILLYDIKKQILSLNAFACIIAFMLLHVIAARWIYSYVPYQHWLDAILPDSISNKFHTKRNYFDRLIHFSYGLFLSLPFYELFRKTTSSSKKVCLLLSFFLIVVSSVFYEWFEWAISLTLSPQDAENYNGQQGDVWDAHKDMLMATIGSFLSLLPLHIKLIYINKNDFI